MITVTSPQSPGRTGRLGNATSANNCHQRACGDARPHQPDIPTRN